MLLAAMAEAFLKWGRGEGGQNQCPDLLHLTTRAGSGVARNFQGGGGGA